MSQDCVRFQHASAQPHLGCWCCTWVDSADTMVRSVYDVYDVVPTSVYSASVCAGGMVSPWPSQYPDQYPDMDWDHDDKAVMRFIERGSVVFERSMWRFAAGFEGNEDLLTWYRDPQYRRCECLTFEFCPMPNSNFAVCADDDVWTLAQ